MRKRMLALALVIVLASVRHQVTTVATPMNFKEGESMVTLDTSNNTSYSGTFTRIYCQNRGAIDGTFNTIIKLQTQLSQKIQPNFGTGQQHYYQTIVSTPFARANLYRRLFPNKR